MANNIKKHTGYEVVIINNIVDTKIFKYSNNSRENRAFTFISAGSLIYGKGMDILIKAFSTIKRKDVKLIIMGDGPKRNELSKLAEKLGCMNQIIFHGSYVRKDLSKFFKESDCFVLASRLETFGVVYIEALASGLPIIATKCGGPEIFTNETNGLLVPVEDIDSLAKAMEHMILNINRYNLEEISKYAYKEFSPNNIATKIFNLYKKVIDKG